MDTRNLEASITRLGYRPTLSVDDGTVVIDPVIRQRIILDTQSRDGHQAGYALRRALSAPLASQRDVDALTREIDAYARSVERARLIRSGRVPGPLSTSEVVQLMRSGRMPFGRP